jgi:hypothetical protein
MKSKLEVRDLLRRLLFLEQHEADVDTPDNPLKSRKVRVLAMRRRVVKALGKGSSASKRRA